MSNLSQSLLLRRQMHGEKTAYIFEKEVLTFKDLKIGAYKTASYLHDVGIRPQQKIAFVLDDCLLWPIYFHAFVLIGCIPILIHPYSTEKEIKNILVTTEPDWTVSSKSINLNLDSDRVKSNLIYIEDVNIDNQPEFSEVYDFNEFDHLLMMATSGTTGIPKIIVHKHHNLEQAFLSPNPYHYQEQSVVLCSVKMASSWGFLASILGTIATGMCSFIFSQSSLKNIFRIIEQNKVTHLLITPKIIEFLVKQPVTSDVSSLKYIFSSGEALSQSVGKKFTKKFNLDIFDSYGASEVRCWGILVNNKTYNKAGSLGIPGPGIEYKLVDENYRLCKDRDPGFLMIKHSNVAIEYFKDPENTKKTFQNGWFFTGDIMYKDDEDFFYYAGRKGQVLIKHNRLYSCHDLENKLKNIDSSMDHVAVIDPEKNTFVIFAHSKFNKTLPEIKKDILIIDPNFEVDLISDIYKIKIFPITSGGKKVRNYHQLISLL